MSPYVTPESPGATHQISLQGAGRVWGIKLKRGARSIVESPSKPTNIELGSGGKRQGDFDPSFAHISMRDWSGGRGSEYLVDDDTQYYDGYGWSLTPGVWHQAPQWSFAEGSSLTGDILMPGANRNDVGNSMSFHSWASTFHRARSVRASCHVYDIKRVQTWVRRIGVPPCPLKIGLSTSYSTADWPASDLTSASTGVVSLESSDTKEFESFIWTAELSTVVNQDGTTTKYIFAHIFTTQAGTEGNHWEVGYNSSYPSTARPAVYSAYGTTANWGVSRIHFFFRLAPAKTAGRGRRWKLFEMERALYAVSQDADGGASVVYINGARAQHSSNVAGTTDAFHANTISSKLITLTGATLAIIKGTGSGQESLISTVTASSGAGGGAKFGISLDIAPSTDSEMVIYDTHHWEQVSQASTAIGSQRVEDVSVGADTAYFALGADTTNIGAFYWNSSVHASTQYGSAEGGAAVLHAFHNPIDGPQMHKAVSSDGDIQRGDIPTTKGSSIPFTTVVTPCGSSNYPFTNLSDYGGFLYAAKEDSLWAIKDDKAEKINVGLDAFPSSNNGRSLYSQNLLFHFSWSHSLERLYQGTVDDIGPWRGAGLKPGHQGPIAGSIPVIAWSFHGIDAGTTGRSAVMAWDGQRGWHEVHRAYSTGYRIQGIHFQNNPNARPRLWISEGGELISMQFPKDTLNPRNDKELHYQHESVLETATIDMGAMQLKKLFYEIDAHTQNLSPADAHIHVEYQLDDNIRSSNWISVGKFSRSPQDELFIRRGNKHAIRFRFRALTENSTVPSELHAATLKVVGRTPVKRLWSIEAKTGDFQVDSQGLQDSDPDLFYAWLREAAENNEPLLMRSVWRAMDNIYVFAEHPVLNRTFTTPEGDWGGSLRLQIREV
jgi:hypothetical protein